MCARTKTFERLFWGSVSIVGAASLVGIVLLWRGIRAAESPSAFETALARRARDVAIPWKEHRTKNPLAGDSEALQQGHELFLVNCAICHGLDGSGATRIGTNLYPRVPDLRASSTQSLSDGQVHF